MSNVSGPADSASGDGERPEAALAREIRRRREAAGLSQNQLADRIRYSRQYVSRAERASGGFVSAELVSVIDTALDAGGALVELHARLRRQRIAQRGVPSLVACDDSESSEAVTPAAQPLGLVDAVVMAATAGGRSPDPVASSAEEEAMKRRMFLAHAAAVTVGALPFDLDNWSRITSLEESAPARLASSDVEHVESMTTALRALDWRHGGGGCRPLAEAHLDRARRLLTVPCTDEVRRRLWVAVADLHSFVGWTSFDTGQADAARHHLARALELSQAAREPSLVATVLYRAGRLHLHAGYSEDALRLFQLGQISARDSGSELSLALLCANEAWAHGCLGDSRRARQSMLRARDSYARAQREDEPRWATFVTDAELDGLDGVTHVALARSDAAHAARGIELLQASLSARGQDMARSQVFDTTAVATAYLYMGEVDHGVRHGRRAIEMAEVIRSTRVTDRLVPLAQAAASHNGADARDLRAEIDRVRAVR